MSKTHLILSVPAGDSYDLILQHLIHSCPDDPLHHYGETNWIAFRQDDGTMERVFKIDRIVRLAPVEIEATHEVLGNLRERIARYLSAAQNRKHVIDEPSARYRFYFLKEHNKVIQLPHCPPAESRRLGPIYMEGVELETGRSVVKPLR